MSSPAPITRLLVIDDDLLLCELLNQLLRSEGFEVATRTSAESALALLASDPGNFDAVLTDLQMPEISGLRLAPRLRELSHGALLVGMSARAPLAHERAAFDAFLTKPFSVPELRLALDEAYRGHAAGVHTVVSSTQEGQRSEEAFRSPRHVPEKERSSTEAGSLPSDAEAELGASSPEAVLDQRIFAQLRSAVGHAPLRQLYEMTASDVDSRLSRMRASLLAGDHEEVRKEAHAIKGSCAMVGATELSRLAAGIEAGSETDSAQLAKMQEACRRLRQMVTIVPP